MTRPTGSHRYVSMLVDQVQNLLAVKIEARTDGILQKLSSHTSIITGYQRDGICSKGKWRWSHPIKLSSVHASSATTRRSSPIHKLRHPTPVTEASRGAGRPPLSCLGAVRRRPTGLELCRVRGCDASSCRRVSGPWRKARRPSTRASGQLPREHLQLVRLLDRWRFGRHHQRSLCR